LFNFLNVIIFPRLYVFNILFWTILFLHLYFGLGANQWMAATV